MRHILSILFILAAWLAHASHIVGGDIYYDYLGNNQYRFYITVYRDCNSSGAAFDNPLTLTIYNSSGATIDNLQVPFNGSALVPPNFDDPCLNTPPNVCTEVTTYTQVVTLPPIPGGYTITYQRCCRGPNITNLQFPDDTGFTLTCVVPGTTNNNYVNSSPRFNNYPPLVICANDDLVFDHSATDPDGDVMVYSLTTPYSGASSGNPMPNPAPPPPYTPVTWNAGYSAAAPLGPGSSVTIDPNTGLLNVSPNLTGLFVVGIQVEEYRNGVLINRTIRDFLFNVFMCDFSAQADLPLQSELSTFVSYCNGLTVQFENNTFGAQTYAWDFGVPGITTDVSTLFEPTYTYPAPGDYTVMMVMNPGLPCTDTAYMDIMVYNEISATMTVSDDTMCILDNNFDFSAITDGPPGTTITWDFGPNATPSSATGPNVDDVVFNQAGAYEITVTASYAVCEGEDIDSVVIIPEPIADIIVPNQVECAGLTIQFTNNTQNATDYSWDFGDGSAPVSTFEPAHTFPSAGTYTVVLSAWSSASCINTDEVTITLNEPLMVSFTSEDSLCFTNNSFNFDGTVSGPAGSVFTWNFGPSATPSTSNETDVPGVHFDTTGAVLVTLTGVWQNCVEVATKEIYIFKEPTIDFTLKPGNQCVPFEAHFIDLSFSETPLSYFWDFGDGGTSTDQNPIHVYTVPGPYPVTLTIISSQGCVVNLSLTNDSLVHVRPKPEAGFKVSPDYTDICHSLVDFTDLSEGASEWFYWFDDSTIYSFEQNIAHLYYRDGHHWPMQIVKNEWECSDTAYSHIYIEPFTLYAPNSFTPDGDEFNNTFAPIVYLELVEWKLEIYDRWGLKVFESQDIRYGWDGTGPNGRLVQPGSYLWKITYVSCEPFNPRHVVTGHVSLLR